MPVDLLIMGLTVAMNTTPIQVESAPEAPSVAFLEFLGNWETEDGTWLPPEVMEAVELPANADEQGRKGLEKPDPETRKSDE